MEFVTLTTLLNFQFVSNRPNFQQFSSTGMPRKESSRRPRRDHSEKHPSEAKTVWKTHGRYRELAEFVTYPQEDHRPSSTGIEIRSETDRRAQPWVEHVQANMHSKEITSLPSKKASEKDVREWIYLILAHRSLRKIIDNITGYTGDITATVSRMCETGVSIRNIRNWKDLVPTSWTTIYGETVQVSKASRRAIIDRLNSIILPLLDIEQAHYSMFESTSDEKCAAIIHTPKVLPLILISIN
jgi:hypothetical protein